MNYSAIFSTPTRTASSTLHSVSTFITHVPDFSELRPSGSDKRTSGSVCAAEEDGKQAIVQDYLTPLKLVQLSGEPDLSRVAFLELSVNTTENSLGNFGKWIVSLLHVHIPSLLFIPTSLCRACFIVAVILVQERCFVFSFSELHLTITEILCIFKFWCIFVGISICICEVSFIL